MSFSDSNTQKLFKFIGTAVSIITWTGCTGVSSPTSSIGSGAGASFNNTRVEILNSFLAGTEKNATGEPLSTRIYSLRTCIRDSGTLQPVLDQDFEIRSDLNTSSGKPRKTDLTGCLIWEESLTYPAKDPSRYFDLERWVVGTGKYPGQAKLSFQLNPWEEGSGLVDKIWDQRSAPTTSAKSVFTVKKRPELTKGKFEPADSNSNQAMFGFSIRICLQEATQQPLALNANFEIELKPLFKENIASFASETVKSSLDEEGCLDQIVSELSFSPFAGQTEYRFALSIRGISEPYLNQTENFEVGIFPLEQKLWDYRESGAPVHLERAEQSAEIQVKNFSYELQRNGLASVSVMLEPTIERDFDFFVEYEIGKSGQNFDLNKAFLEKQPLYIRGVALFPNLREQENFLKSEDAQELLQQLSKQGNGECTRLSITTLACPFWGKAQINFPGKLSLSTRLYYNVRDFALLSMRGNIVMEVLSDPDKTHLLPARFSSTFLAFAGARKTIGEPKILNDQNNILLTAFQALDLKRADPKPQFLVSQDAVATNPTFKGAGADSRHIFNQLHLGNEHAWNRFVEKWFYFYQNEKATKFVTAARESEKVNGVFNEDKATEYWEPRLLDNPFDANDLFSLALQFCEVLFVKGSQDYHTCYEQPAQKIAFIPFRHVEKINAIHFDQSGYPLPQFKKDLSVSYFHETGTSLSQFEGNRTYLRTPFIRGALDRRLLLNLGIGFEFGHEGFYIEQYEDREAIRQRAKADTTVTFIRDTLYGSFDADIRKCLWISPRPLKPSETIEGIHLCKTKIEKSNVTEQWTTMNWLPVATDITGYDQYGAHNSSDFQVFRGETPARQFDQLIESNINWLIQRLDSRFLRERLELGGIFDNHLKVYKYWGRNIGSPDTHVLGSSAFSEVSQLFDFSRYPESAIQLFLLDGSIPGTLDVRDWTGPQLLQYYLKKDN